MNKLSEKEIKKIYEVYKNLTFGEKKEAERITGVKFRENNVLVLKKNKENKDVLFIDASKNFEKGKNQNVLRKEDIDKIIDTYKERKDVDKYAHVATIDEIKENDYNLNIPRYVDTFEPEPPVDLGKLTKEMEETQKEIEQTQGELLGMMKELTSKDEKTQKDLNEFIKMLENEVKRNG